MSTQEAPTAKEMTPQETAATLQRILDAVEEDGRNRWVEIACAVVLSLAMFGSAWCAYEANLWNGVQTFRLNASNRASRASHRATLAALQAKAFDGSMLISYLQAKTQDNQRLEKILYDRFRPEMKTALDAWLKTDPLNNSSAPPTPFKMEEYVQKELNDVKARDAESASEFVVAEHANEVSDNYVLLTVKFTAVLFFGGIAGSFRSRRLRICVLAIALVLFLLTSCYLGTMPICQE